MGKFIRTKGKETAIPIRDLYISDTHKDKEDKDLLEAESRLIGLLNDDDSDPEEVLRAQEELRALLEKRRSENS